MRLATDETFGPVAPFRRFRTDTEAIALANSTRFGLAAYVFCADPRAAFLYVDHLEAGVIRSKRGRHGCAWRAVGGREGIGARTGGREIGPPGIRRADHDRLAAIDVPMSIADDRDLEGGLVEATLRMVDSLVSPRVALLRSEVLSTAEWLYSELLQFLCEVLARLVVDLQPTEPGVTSIHDGRSLLGTSEGGVARYCVHASPRLGRPYEVDVSIMRVDDLHVGTPMPVLLASDGRFVLARLTAPESPPLIAERAELAARTVLDVGDRAIESFVVSQLAFDSVGAVASIYAAVRRYFDQGGRGGDPTVSARPDGRRWHASRCPRPPRDTGRPEAQPAARVRSREPS